MLKVVVCLAVLAATSGCVNGGSVPPPHTMTAAYAGKPLTFVTHKAPRLGVLTWFPPQVITLPYPDTGVRSQDGDQIVQANKLDDPALAIASMLTSVISKRLVTSDTKSIADIDDANTTALAGLAANQGVVLDVKTTAWQILYYTFDWTHYRTMYRGQARLIDAANDKLIAQIPCAWDSSDENPPTYSELLANRASLLKSQLSDATKSCASIYTKALLPD